MIIITRDFSEVEISENQVIDFPAGIFAFEDNREFVLLSPLGDDVYPMWLQSVTNPDLCFIVFNPFEFVPDYSVILDKEAAEIINYAENDEIMYLSIAVIPEEYKDSTVNLKSPVIINFSNNKAVQFIANENYPLKHPVFLKEES